MSILEVNKKLYHVLGHIGKGGFSQVFSCVSFKKSRCVALKKVNLSKLDADGINQVLNEIELLKKLQDSRKVVQLYD